MAASKSGAAGAPEGSETVTGPRSSFREGLFAEAQVEAQTGAYAGSTPYKHGVIDGLMEDGLLRGVLGEIRDKIHFTEKATDIYRIWQSGDLANLDGLDAASASALPNLLALRDALYSAEFRAYLSAVTGAGPLSGSKTDMAVNIYKPGCYLLCHDDVIGSRRVSYILYLTPDWKAEWGGALRLYDTYDAAIGDKSIKVPLSWHDPARAIPPAWNQLSFFAVQPGESYHDVEEVYPSGSAAGDDQRTRIAISGWFHLPQEGEEGFVEGMAARLAKESSLAQLQRTDAHFDRPAPEPQALEPLQDADADQLSEAELDELVGFVSPQYLLPDAVEALAGSFEADSAASLPCFLSKRFAERVGTAIAALPETVPQKIEDGDADWDVAGPPHKQRFLFKAQPKDEALAELAALFRRPAFRKWLALITGLALTSHDVRVRRFRRGYDYQLAQNYDEDQPRLEMTLGVTPGKDQTEAGKWWVPPDADEEEDEEEAEAEPQDKGKGTKRKRAPDEEAEEAPSKKAKGDSTSDEAAAMAEAAAQAEPKPDAQEEAYELETGGEEVYMAGDDGEAEGSDEAPTEIDEDEDERRGGFRPASSSGSSDSATSSPATRRAPGPGTAATSFGSAAAHSQQASSQQSTAPDTTRPKASGQSGTGAAHARPAPRTQKQKADPAVYQAEGDDEDDAVLYSNAPEWNTLHLVLRDGGVLRFVKYLGAAAPRDRWDVAAEWGVEWDGDDEA